MVPVGQMALAVCWLCPLFGGKDGHEEAPAGAAEGHRLLFC